MFWGQPHHRPCGCPAKFDPHTDPLPCSRQAVVYRTIGAPIVHDVMHGVHGCIIAYGQTGAGKTFSLMDLSHGRLGLIPRALHEIFDRIEHAGPSKGFAVKMSYLQIYMEQVYDLLQQTGERLEVLPLTPGTDTSDTLTAPTGMRHLGEGTS